MRGSRQLLIAKSKEGLSSGKYDHRQLGSRDSSEEVETPGDKEQKAYSPSPLGSCDSSEEPETIAEIADKVSAEITGLRRKVQELEEHLRREREEKDLYKAKSARLEEELKAERAGNQLGKAKLLSNLST